MQSGKYFEMNLRKCIIVVILSLLTGDAELESIITKPADATGKLGRNVEFACEVTFGPIPELSWEFNGKIIYYFSNGNQYYPLGTRKYAVTISGGNFTLALKNLIYTDGGKYTCSLSTANANAVLIVLGTPHITSPPNPVEGENVTYMCEAQFGGPRKEKIPLEHYPQLVMFFVGGKMVELQCGTDTKDQGNYYQLSKPYNMTVEANMHNNTLACEIGTSYPMMNATTFTQLNVLYSVQNTTYLPHQDKYEVGSTLTCMANGNPPPVFAWEDDSQCHDTISGMLLNIIEDMVGNNLWKCTAKNYLKGKEHEDSVTVNFEAEYHSGFRKSTGIPVYLITCIVVLLICAVCVSVTLACWWRRKWIVRRENAVTNDDEDVVLPLREEMHTELIPLHDDTNLLDSSKAFECMKLIEKLCNKKDMATLGAQVLDMIDENGNKILGEDPFIFMAMINKANILIESELYIDIVKKMAAIYAEIPNKPKEGPLQCLSELMSDETSCKKLFNNQQQMHSLIQELTISDGVHSRTKFLLTLLMQSEYISKSTNVVTWTEALLSSLKLLLKEGADPTWIAADLARRERSNRYSAQYKFFLGHS